MFLQKVAKNRHFNWIIAIMGLLAIPLLMYNLWIADPVDKVFAFVELAVILLIFGIFIQMFEDNKPWGRRLGQS